MASGKPTGCFIAFEGPEGSGKTTQARILADRLAAAGFNVDATREPGGTDVGERIRKILLEEYTLQRLDARVQALLVSAARAQHVVERIKPQLERGGVVVCDRFAASTLAYQGAGFRLDRRLLEQVGEVASAGVAPDLVVLVDIDVETGLSRSLAHRHADWEKAGGVNWNDIEFHRRVRDAYLELAADASDTWLVVDGRMSIDSIATAIWTRVETELSRHELNRSADPRQRRLPLGTA